MTDTFLLDIRDAYFAMTREFSKFGIEIIGNPDGFNVYYANEMRYGEKHVSLAAATMEALEQYISRRDRREADDDER